MVQPIDNIDEDYAFLLTSKARANIMLVLYKEKTLMQTEIAKKIKSSQQNIWKPIDQLVKAKLIICLTPGKRSWKVYQITEYGKQVVEYYKERQK